jgi:hypothetical protein
MKGEERGRKEWEFHFQTARAKATERAGHERGGSGRERGGREEG